jgi:hypothetical protein
VQPDISLGSCQSKLQVKSQQKFYLLPYCIATWNILMGLTLIHKRLASFIICLSFYFFVSPFLSVGNLSIYIYKNTQASIA